MISTKKLPLDLPIPLTTRLTGNLINPITNSILEVKTVEDGFTKPQLVKVDGSDFVASFNDISNNNNNLTIAAQLDKPQYISQAINNLPGILFDGIDHRLSLATSFLENTDFTIFVVEQRTSSNNNDFFIGGNSNTNGIRLGYSSNINLRFEVNGKASAINVTVPGFSTAVNRIHSLITKDEGGGNVRASLFVNGALGVFQVASDGRYVVDTMGSLTLAKQGAPQFYKGFIGEVIVYNRALSDAERSQVEKYLSAKWKIALS